MSPVICIAPEYPKMRRFHKAVFMAGGITGCPDWQTDAINLFDKAGADCVLLNPRQANFDVTNPDAALHQITWEHRMLREADAVLFWFCPDTIQPIVLYELGAWTNTPKNIFIGVDPNYERRQDVRIQTGLVRPEVEIVSDLMALIQQVCDWLKR